MNERKRMAFCFEERAKKQKKTLSIFFNIIFGGKKREREREKKTSEIIKNKQSTNN